MLEHVAGTRQGRERACKNLAVSVSALCVCSDGWHPPRVCTRLERVDAVWTRSSTLSCTTCVRFVTQNRSVKTDARSLTLVIRYTPRVRIRSSEAYSSSRGAEGRRRVARRGGGRPTPRASPDGLDRRTADEEPRSRAAGRAPPCSSGRAGVPCETAVRPPATHHNAHIRWAARRCAGSRQASQTTSVCAPLT